MICVIKIHGHTYRWFCCPHLRRKMFMSKNHRRTTNRNWRVGQLEVSSHASHWDELGCYKMSRSSKCRFNLFYMMWIAQIGTHHLFVTCIKSLQTITILIPVTVNNKSILQWSYSEDALAGWIYRDNVEPAVLVALIPVPGKIYKYSNTCHQSSTSMEAELHLRLLCPATSLLFIIQVCKLNAAQFKFSKWKGWTKLALIIFSNKRSRKFFENSYFCLGLLLRRKRKIYFPWIFGSWFLPLFSGRVHEVLWRHLILV